MALRSSAKYAFGVWVPDCANAHSPSSDCEKTQMSGVFVMNCTWYAIVLYLQMFMMSSFRNGEVLISPSGVMVIP